MFSDEFRFYMSYNNGRIRVRRYASERILQRHRRPTPSIMVWDEIGYNMRSRLLRIEGNLTATATLGRFYSPRDCPSFRQPTCHISAGQYPDKRGKDCASLLPKTMGITASLACTFPRHVTHQTCLGYGWSETYSSGSSITYSWRFVDSHTNCVEGHSPGRHPGPPWFHATTHSDSECSARSPHTILKSHAHRPCTVLKF